MFGTPVSCPLAYCAYNKVSEGYGSAGIEVKSPDDGVENALRAAQGLSSDGVPVVVNVHIGKTSFREGSLSV